MCVAMYMHDNYKDINGTVGVTTRKFIDARTCFINYKCGTVTAID